MAAIIFGRSNKTEQYDLFTTLPNSDPTTDIIVKYFPEQKNMKLAQFFAPGVTFFRLASGDCGKVVKQSPRNQEFMGSSPARC